MGNGFQFFDIILFAMIAAFLVLRLRGVLGRRDGHEGGHQDPFRPDRQGQEPPDNVVPLPGRTEEDQAGDESSAEASPADTPLAAGITQIKVVDPQFTEEDMLSGARIAFEMILNAYTAGDTATLKPLLSAEVFDNFARSIVEREELGHTLDETLVGIRSAEIVEAYMEDSEAHVTIKFISDQVAATRDGEGQVVEGDPNAVTEVTDFWTFARDTRSRDPNWILVATRSLE